MAWPTRIWGTECKCCYDKDTWSIDLRPLQATNWAKKYRVTYLWWVPHSGQCQIQMSPPVLTWPPMSAWTPGKVSGWPVIKSCAMWRKLDWNIKWTFIKFCYCVNFFIEKWLENWFFSVLHFTDKSLTDNMTIFQSYEVYFYLKSHNPDSIKHINFRYPRIHL